MLSLFFLNHAKDLCDFVLREVRSLITARMAQRISTELMASQEQNAANLLLAQKQPRFLAPA